MKLLLIIVFASTLGVHAFSQKDQLTKSENQLANSEKEYTKMFHNSKIKMARSHSEFYAEAKKNKILWKYFKDYKFASTFLKEMQFCKDGLITINLVVKDAEFEAEVGKVLGFGQVFWAKWKKGYCCEDDWCSPCSIHSKCNSNNCGKDALKGDFYNPAKVLGG